MRLHDLRHSFASHAAAKSETLSMISKLLGHTDVTTTARYTHLDDRQVVETAQRIGNMIEEAMGESRLAYPAHQVSSLYLVICPFGFKCCIEHGAVAHQLRAGMGGGVDFGELGILGSILNSLPAPPITGRSSSRPDLLPPLSSGPAGRGGDQHFGHDRHRGYGWSQLPRQSSRLCAFA